MAAAGVHVALVAVIVCLRQAGGVQPVSVALQRCLQAVVLVDKHSIIYYTFSLIMFDPTLISCWHFSDPTRISPLKTSAFQEFFPNLTEVFIFLKMSKKRSNYESSAFLRIYRGEEMFFWLFLSKILVTG